MATEKRLVDAIALISKARRMETTDNNGIPVDTFAVPVMAIEDAPTVDAVEVVYGRWEDMYDGKYDIQRFRCSVCKEKSLFKDKRNELGNWMKVQALTPFCPHCGATLDGGWNNDI